MLPVSMIVMLPVIGKSDDIVGVVGGVVVTAECMVMLVSILLTEKALAKQFDGGIR